MHAERAASSVLLFADRHHARVIGRHAVSRHPHLSLAGIAVGSVDCLRLATARQPDGLIVWPSADFTSVASLAESVRRVSPQTVVWLYADEPQEGADFVVPTTVGIDELMVRAATELRARAVDADAS